ncbi:hypothetical protein OH492_27970 [Vibrio chagasii]|nr:hypothetical protein [Vibrio chagasii]
MTHWVSFKTRHIYSYLDNTDESVIQKQTPAFEVLCKVSVKSGSSRFFRLLPVNQAEVGEAINKAFTLLTGHCS